MYSQDELDEHLRVFTKAWLDYKATYDQPERQLAHLEATARCNREIAWLWEHSLGLFTDVVWSNVAEAFVLTEK